MGHVQHRFYAECKFEDFRIAHTKDMYALYSLLLENTFHDKKNIVRGNKRAFQHTILVYWALPVSTSTSTGPFLLICYTV